MEFDKPLFTSELKEAAAAEGDGAGAPVDDAASHRPGGVLGMGGA